MSSNSLTRKAPKQLNEMFKSKTLLSKVMTLLVVLSNLKLNKKETKFFSNRPLFSNEKQNYGKNYGRVFNKLGKRINKEMSSSEKIEKFAKKLIASDSLGYFLANLKQELKPLKKPEEYFKDAKSPNMTKQFHHINGNFTGTPVPSLDWAPKLETDTQINKIDMLINDIEKTAVSQNTTESFYHNNGNLTEIREGGLRNVKQSFRSSTRKAKRRSMHRSH